MTIVMFGRKRGLLASQRTPSQPWSTGWQHHVVRVLGCRRDWCTSQNRWHHEVGKLRGYIEATSQDISQEVKAFFQMGLPHEQWPQAYFQSCGKMALGQQSQGIGVAITKPWPQSKCVVRTEKVCEQGGLQTWLSYTTSIRRNGPNFTQLIVGSLWKAIWNVWPKLNNLMAMLSNTNWCM